VTRSGFGTPLFIGPTDPAGGRPKVASYANLAEVLAVYANNTPEYNAALAFFGQNPKPSKMLIGYKASGEAYDVALAAIRAINDDWFFLTVASRAKADALLLAPIVNALPGLRQTHFTTNESITLDGASTTATAVELGNLNLKTAFLAYHPTATLYPEMAVLGRVAIQRETGNVGPGSFPSFYQPVAGITASVFTSTQRALLETRKVNYFQTLANNVRVFGGKSTGGEWFDVMYFAAWLQARVSENVTELLTRAADRQEKVPFTDDGIAAVEAAITEVLDVAVRIGGILPDYKVTTPKRSQTTFADRTNRYLNGITFVANLQGAVRTVQIRGTLVA
jgi:hypothetical protein